eukprot:TRINITY_DN959_c0_g1_i1.p1 TRINITY_DN959_c0_g1~~TRINITY_DN959_c0_g1_i1.p1  ORF type:complete len:691 (-),score=232.56 TRINITY_DN959_c0_g1_i1:58-2130(-)
MAALAGMLPLPRNVAPARFAARDEEEEVASKLPQHVPAYPKRKGFVPRTQADFGDGGAYPESHVAQYPLDMGRRKKSATGTNSVSLSMDSEGRVNYDSVITGGKGRRDGQKVYGHSTDMIVRNPDNLDLEKPNEEEVKATAQRTRDALNGIVSGKVDALRATTLKGGAKEEPTFIRYTAQSSHTSHNSGAQQRIIRLVEAPVDPLEPPKFKHKKAPAAPGDDPVPVMHSPPRKVTLQDQQTWKIPPCVSNWKNNKGYTIPLDKRLAADGRGLQQVQINERFASFSESLNLAVRRAREEVSARSDIRQREARRENDQKESQLRRLAQETREQRSGLTGETPAPIEAASEARRRPSTLRRPAGDDEAPRRLETPSSASASSSSSRRRTEVDSSDDEEEERRGKKRDRGDNSSDEDDEDDAYKERQRLRSERKRERERERRKDAQYGAKKAKRDDRDMSERVALGEKAAASGTGNSDTQYDTRLFNQKGGVGEGFGADDGYNVYDKALFHGGTSGMLHKAKKADDDNDNPEGAMERLEDSARFKKPDRGFQGAEKGTGEARTGPVAFEKDEDPFGFDEFLTNTKKGKEVETGKAGSMHATGGGAKGLRDDDDARSGYGRHEGRGSLSDRYASSSSSSSSSRDRDRDRDGGRDRDSSRRSSSSRDSDRDSSRRSSSSRDSRDRDRRDSDRDRRR